MRCALQDIEGAELGNCQELLAQIGKADRTWAQRVNYLTIELHDRFPGYEKDTETCHAALSKAGLKRVGQFGELTAYCRSCPKGVAA